MRGESQVRYLGHGTEIGSRTQDRMASLCFTFDCDDTAVISFFAHLDYLFHFNICNFEKTGVTQLG